MLNSVLAKTLFDRRRSFVWWSIGIAAYVALMDSVYPFIRDSAGQFEELFDSFPEALRALFGIDGEFDLFSPVGYLESRTFGWVVPVVLSIYAGALGSRLVAGEEESGTMDLLLAQPVSRRSVMLV